MDEAKETAIELFLTAPTWENVATYFTFSGQGISDSLKLYIEHYDTELGRTICPDTISEKEQLFDVYIASCVLEIDSFKRYYIHLTIRLSIVNLFQISIHSV